MGIHCKQKMDLFNWENGKEVRTIIKYFCKKGMSPKEIHDDFIKTIGDEFPSYSTVKKWAAEFRRGIKSMEDYERSDQYQGCPRYQLDGSPKCWPKIKRRAGLIFLSIFCLSMKMTLRNVCDETWNHHFDPEAKKQSMQWKHLAHPLLRN